MKKKIGIISIVILAFIALAYNYVYQDHRDIENEKAEFTLSTKTLINEFLVNPNKSEKEYLNKVIEVTGVVTEINNNNNITLDNKVFCQLDNSNNSNIKIGQAIAIKGRIIGYDDLLEEIKLDQCYLKN